MKKIFACICILALAFALTACSADFHAVHQSAYEALKEEFPYFFCELMPPSPI